MKEETFRKGMNAILIVVIVITAIGFGWNATLEKSHDQHMIDTVNERAMNYVSDNGTITDFAVAEILDNDAQLEYEERVWKLDHPGIYWAPNAILALVFSILWTLVVLFGKHVGCEDLCFD